MLPIGSSRLLPLPPLRRSREIGFEIGDVGARASDGNEGRRRMVIRVIREFC